MASSNIHSTAIIAPGAKLGAGVTVGAYAYVGPDVTLGDGCTLHHHACVEGFTSLGPACEVFPFAVIGGRSQDLKARPGKPGLRVGARNTFREYVSVHLGTQEGEFTILGEDNHLLAYAHIAHDCVVGNHLVMSSHSALGGHVHLGNNINIGWSAGVHQFCQVGDYAMVAACSKLTQDVPPFVIADGNPAAAKMINKVGLLRNGFSEAEVDEAKTLYRLFYRDGLNTTQALAQATALPFAQGRVAKAWLGFVGESKRGLA